jgi:hypothetical protein
MLKYLNINLSKYCKDQDIEVCALQLESTDINICVIKVCRTAVDNFNSFVIGLDSIMKSLYRVEFNFIICGVVNVDYVMNSDKKDNLLLCYCPIIYQL